MPFFPFFVDITQKKCIVIGGGNVALRKVEKLLSFKPDITVIAPAVCDDLSKYSDIHIERREFTDSDIDGAFMVITATDDRALNKRVYELCREKKIPVNTVDDIDNCSFIFPALATKNDVTIGISTGGKSPIFAKYIRRTAEQWLGGDNIEIAELLSRYRPIIRKKLHTEAERKKVMESLLEFCLTEDRIPTDMEIQTILEDFKT